MGRIRTDIKIGDETYWTLFDSGARNTYIVEEVAAKLTTFDLPKPNPVSLGGKMHNVVKGCSLICKVEGYDMVTHARVLEEIGQDEEEKKKDNIKIDYDALKLVSTLNNKNK